jgi:hypothetical protein
MTQKLWQPAVVGLRRIDPSAPQLKQAARDSKEGQDLVLLAPRVLVVVRA